MVVYEDTYMTLQEANEIVEKEYTSFDKEKTVWDSLSDNDKSVIIMRTTKNIDNDSFLYIGRKAEPSQKMEFPRIYHGRYLDVPDDIKRGIILLATSELDKKMSDEGKLIEKGVKSYKIKDASVEFFSDAKDYVNVGNIRMPKTIWDSCFSEYSLVC